MIVRAPRFIARLIAWAFRMPGPPLAMTIGALIVNFSGKPLPDMILRHELEHVRQAADEAPRSLPEWARPWIGAPELWLKYGRLYRAYGYRANPLEVEARKAAGEPLE